MSGSRADGGAGGAEGRAFASGRRDSSRAENGRQGRGWDGGADQSSDLGGADRLQRGRPSRGPGR